MKRAIPILLVAGLSGCHPHGELEITNLGPEAVELSVTYWLEEEEYDDGCECWVTTFRGYVTERDVVGPRETIRFWYPTDDLEVLIRRQRDFRVLFEADYSPGDFEDDHGTIEITVAP